MHACRPYIQTWSALRRPDKVPAGVRNRCDEREALRAWRSKLKGFDMDTAVMTGVETRSSSPVRIPRDRETMKSINAQGIYPGGEGAGYAGGRHVSRSRRHKDR